MPEPTKEEKLAEEKRLAEEEKAKKLAEKERLAEKAKLAETEKPKKLVKSATPKKKQQSYSCPECNNAWEAAEGNNICPKCGTPGLETRKR